MICDIFRQDQMLLSVWLSRKIPGKSHCADDSSMGAHWHNDDTFHWKPFNIRSELRFYGSAEVFHVYSREENGQACLNHFSSQTFIRRLWVGIKQMLQISLCFRI